MTFNLRKPKQPLNRGDHNFHRPNEFTPLTSPCLRQCSACCHEGLEALSTIHGVATCLRVAFDALIPGLKTVLVLTGLAPGCESHLGYSLNSLKGVI